MTKPEFQFCSISAARVFYTGKHVLAIWDGFAESPGHALIVPKRHVASWFEASEEERAEILKTIDIVRAAIVEEHAPDGYNVGLNDGAHAGQTILHLHLHVIPRYAGDVPDPRGGIRHVIPDKAAYCKHQFIDFAKGRLPE